MSFLIGITLTLLSICNISKALPDFHKQMSPQQLQSVFHVDSIGAVPHYEVVQLLHQHAKAEDLSTLLQRRRRSINIDPAAGSYKASHHVKKDLSKNPYFSELKVAAAAASANSVHSESKEKVSPHDFMNIRDIKEHNVSFSAFGEDLNLTLRATQGLFKDGPHKLRMWTVSSEPNATHGLDMQEVSSDEDSHSSEEIGELFQDEANLAAILMRRHLETGDLIMEGSIGHGMVIKPLPHELSPHKDQMHHVIYKRDTSTLDHMGDFAFMEPDDVATSEKLEKLQKRKIRSVSETMAELTDELAVDIGVDEAAADDEMPHKRSKRLAPNIIYPEVLVIVDYDGYRLHGGDNLQVKRYFISFWNGVDLRYRLLKGPRIRISIAGIIISRGRDATPYLERNRVGRDAIDSAAALTDMGKYLFRERRLPVYDIAVAITKYDMCRRRKGGRCTKGTAGFAYVGGACVVNKRLEKVNSVAIIEDTGGFSGIIVAAHEVGHLLGAVHDGSPPPSYLGGPGAQRCRWEDGYIMSDLRHTERGFRWSPCTVQSFHHFLNGDTATCLHNAPHEDSALGRSLPGSLLSLDAQCRRDRGTYACFKDQRVCAQLFCFDAQTGYCVAYRPAAEGSSCGNGLNCLDGRCQPQSVNVIPDFGKQFRVYNVTNNNNIIDNNDIKTGLNEDGEEDEVEDVKSNEAIERRNRKVDVAITTSVQQQQLPITIATTAATITPTRNAIYGVRSTPRTHTFFDAYFKKLQAINASQQQQQQQQQQQSPPTTITATVSSTTSVSSSTSTSSSSSSAATTGQRKADAPSSYDHFGGHFLKRTLISSKNSSRNSSSNKNNSSNNNSNNKHKSTTTTTAQPAYASNYIGDNSNNLPAVANVEQSAVEQQSQQQQQQAQEQPPLPSQQQQLKTQKFTRRQLIRTTQIK